MSEQEGHNWLLTLLLIALVTGAGLFAFTVVGLVGGGGASSTTPQAPTLAIGEQMTGTVVDTQLTPLTILIQGQMGDTVILNYQVTNGPTVQACHGTLGTTLHNGNAAQYTVTPSYECTFTPSLLVYTFQATDLNNGASSNSVVVEG